MMDPRRRLMRVVIVLVMAGLPASLNVSKMRTAAAYDCTPKNFNNCYGTYRWDGWNIGAVTSIKVVELTSGGGDRHISNVMWLGDVNRTCSAVASCWIEAGYTTDQNANGVNKYYYADRRPGKPYAETMLQAIPSSHFEGYATIAIWRNVGSFTVRISNPSGGTIFHGYSESNAMKVDLIEIGQELRGSSGQSAAIAYWRFNRWKDEFSSQWNYQSNEVSPDPPSSNPPYAGWSVRPSRSIMGGSWKSHCC